MLIKPLTLTDGAITRPAASGDMVDTAEGSGFNNTLTTVGAGTILGTHMSQPVFTRSGPTGGYTDTLPSVTALLAALGDTSNAVSGAQSPGSSFQGRIQVPATFRWLYQNTVAQAMTLAVPTSGGFHLGSGTTTIAASLWREYKVTITNSTPQVVIGALTCTNASKVVTGMTAAQVATISVGMSHYSTNSGTDAKVASLQATGFTSDTNFGGTATGTESITFTPSATIDGVRSGTA